MFGLILLYFLGKAFYSLAETHQRHKWLFAVLGVASYYLGSFFTGVFLVLFSEFVWFDVNELSDLALSIIAIPFGLIFASIFYTVLKRLWNKAPVLSEEDILDG